MSSSEPSSPFLRGRSTKHVRESLSPTALHQKGATIHADLLRLLCSKREEVPAPRTTPIVSEPQFGQKPRLTSARMPVETPTTTPKYRESQSEIPSRISTQTHSDDEKKSNKARKASCGTMQETFLASLKLDGKGESMLSVRSENVFSKPQKHDSFVSHRYGSEILGTKGKQPPAPVQAEREPRRHMTQREAMPVPYVMDDALQGLRNRYQADEREDAKTCGRQCFCGCNLI